MGLLRFPCHRLQKKPLVSDPNMHHGTCVTHVPWCMMGLLTSMSVLLNRGSGGKRYRHSQRMRNPAFYVSGKKPMLCMSIPSEPPSTKNYHDMQILWSSETGCVSLGLLVPQIQRIMEWSPQWSHYRLEVLGPHVLLPCSIIEQM